MKRNSSGRTLLLVGFALNIVSIILYFIGIRYIVWIFGCIGFVLILIGVVGIFRSSRNREALTKIVGGLVLLGIGVGGVITQLNNTVSGVYIVSGIPIPLLVVFAIGAIGGIALLVVGIRELF